MNTALNATQERAVISLSANAGMTICKVVEIVCVNKEQVEATSLETHICGVAMTTFFLMQSGRATNGDEILASIENVYFSGVKPRGILGSLRLRRVSADCPLNSYKERREKYHALYKACVDGKDADTFWQREMNHPGLELFQTILWNVFTSSRNLRRPTDAELIKASYDMHEAVLFCYNF